MLPAVHCMDSIIVQHVCKHEQVSYKKSAVAVSSFQSYSNAIVKMPVYSRQKVKQLQGVRSVKHFVFLSLQMDGFIDFILKCLTTNFLS